jgi:uncharacterized membrane protein
MQNLAHGIKSPGRAPPRSHGGIHALTRRNVEIISQLEKEAELKRSAGELVADRIARFCGSMQFVYLHIFWFSAWVVINMGPYAFDPYPFQFLTLTVSLEAIFLSTFLLINQNHQNRLAKARNDLDLLINLLSEQENSAIISMLRRLLAAHDIEDIDEETRVLEEQTRPEEITQQLEEMESNG